MASRILDERYELLERVGSGGMAVVYRGRDLRLGGREVAVKVLHPHLAEREESKRRFKNEADAAARLRHDNILEVYDASEVKSPDSYIVMEFVHGLTLTQLVTEHPFEVPELGAMVTHQVCLAVAHAHDARILHRDIKPENVMIRDDGAVKLMDFGIARAMDVAHLTTTGALMGSPAHMAPEHIEGKELDVRADVFSVGTLLYYLVTGVLPFTGGSPSALLRKILDGEYEPAERVRPSVGRELSAIIDRAMARDPTERTPTVHALTEQLTAYLSGFGIEDPARELARWNVDRKGYERRLRTRIIAELHERSEQAMAAGRRAQALNHLDRILSLDPADADAIELVDRITRSAATRRRQIVLGALTVALFALGGGALWWWSQPPEPVPLLPANPGPAVLPVAVGPELAPPTLPERVELPDRRDTDALPPRAPERWATEADVPIVAQIPPRPIPNGDKTPIPKEPELPTEILVRIIAHPPPVQVEIDGVAITGFPKRARLAPGKHQVVLRHPECAECVQTTRTILVAPDKVDPATQEQTFRLAVELEPATLLVRSDIAGLVFYGAGQLGRTGEPIRIPMKDVGGEERSIRVEAVAGSGETTRTVALAPGRQVTVDVTLGP
jgi:serine/threonine-protein kinase